MTEQVTCAVCNKPTPKLSAIAVQYQGKTVYTCGPTCRQQFASNPMRFAQGISNKSPAASPKSTTQKSTMTSTPPSTPKKP